MIEARVLKGFRDYLPEMMIPRKALVRSLESVFESFGFSPIDTPALEYADILLGKGGGETDKQVYRFSDHGGRDVALRFDLTVPLARFVSQHQNELAFPFRRYHIASVWRGENTQKGRYREFMQCDFDILGPAAGAADLEILLTIRAGFEALGVKGYRVHVNNRRFLNALLSGLGLTDKAPAVLRAVDKFYKIGAEKVTAEMTAEGIEADTAARVLELLGLKDGGGKAGITGKAIFTALERFATITGDNSDGVNNLLFIFKSLEEMGLLEHFAFNPAITRGLDYYTGVVFESFIEDRMEFGSVCSGGRYDNLTALYSKTPVAGVGASFGLDRLLALLEDKGAVSKIRTHSRVLIFNLDENLSAWYQALAAGFRNAGIACETVLEKKKLGQQFALAEKMGIPFVVIAGGDEKASGTFNLKNIITGVEQKGLTLEQAVAQVNELK